MKTILIFLTFCLSITSFAAEFDTIPASNPNIEYTGRIDFSNALAPTFSYSGVSMRSNFEGTSISIILNDAGDRNYFYAILDGNVLPKLQTKVGTQLYEIAKNLKDTIHEIELFRLTEVDFGKTKFLGFVTDKGKSLVQITKKRNLLIEFIGNSITCGYGNEGSNGEKFGPTTENHYMTYAALTSRSFNARHLAVCKSGIGIYRNYDGPVDGSTDCMTNNYKRIFLFDAAPLYTFSQKPDLICIDLGTNDFSTGKGDSARYVKKYLQFLDTVQLKNQNTDILLLLGPMLSGTDLNNVRKYLKFIADSTNKKNNGKVYFFEMSQQTAPFGVDYHPTVAQHIKNAKELVGYINSLKAWNITPLPFVASTKVGNVISLSFNTEITSNDADIAGFKVFENGIEIPVSEVLIDSKDKSTLQITLAKSLTAGSSIKVSYAGTSLETLKKVKLEKFENFQLQNTLKETKISKASVDAEGSKISISFNKSILIPENNSGISVFNSKGENFTIDSIKLAATLQIYLKTPVAKGDSIFLNVTGGILGKDFVEVSPVNRFAAINQSQYIVNVNSNRQLHCNIFPNPTSNNIISYELMETTRNTCFQLINMEGKQVFNCKLMATTGDINLKNIRTGSYLAKIFSDNKEQSFKIILK